MTNASSFDRLEQRLYWLLNDADNEIEKDYFPKHSIDEILNSGILTNDFENSQDLIHHYILKVEMMKQLIPGIIQKHNFKSPASIFNPNYVAQEEAGVRAKILIEEMDFYINHLKKIDETLMLKLSTLGDDRFANAGFRIKLNLSVPEIGSLFNALWEEGVIKDIEGGDLTKKKLAEFIYKNFASKEKAVFSMLNIKNLLSRKDRNAEGGIDSLLSKILKNFESDYNPSK